MKLPLTWPAAPAFSCERSRSPSHLARLAREALIAEAELTPKPGLVDRRSSGSHTDLSLARMMRSAQAIEPYFRKMAEISIGSAPNVELRQNLGAIGRQAERAMYTATEGSNSHKGAIWSLGLLISAAAMQSGTDALHLARIAATIASQEDQYAPVEASHGILVARRYGVAGARHEATTGFPRVTRIGLPILRQTLCRSAGSFRPAGRFAWDHVPTHGHLCALSRRMAGPAFRPAGSQSRHRGRRLRNRRRTPEFPRSRPPAPRAAPVAGGQRRSPRGHPAARCNRATGRSDG